MSSYITRRAKNKYKKILQELRISKGQLQNEGVLIIDIDGSNF